MFTLDELINASEKEYYSNFAYIMQDAIYFSSRFYEWLINNMYEIFDRDEATLSLMLEKQSKLNRTVSTEDFVFKALREYFGDEYSDGECVALSCVLRAFISLKKEELAMEECYEIRDMFVPFNLPISYVVKDLQPLLDSIKSNHNEPFVLFSKIGKAFESDDVSDEIIVGALDEMNFDDKE